jgi:hypothetical protein
MDKVPRSVSFPLTSPLTNVTFYWSSKIPFSSRPQIKTFLVAFDDGPPSPYSYKEAKYSLKITYFG